MPFDATLFDLDNTLCRHEQDGNEVYYGAFEAAGVEPFGEPGELWAALDGDPAPDPAGRLDYLAAGFERVADAHDRPADARALARGFTEVVDFSRVTFVDGAREALALARSHGPVGLVTNGPEYRQSVKLDALDLTGAFDVVVFAGDLPRRKPHADPFERAVGALDVAAGRTLHVGDSLEHDVAGARNAGLRAAWYRHGVDADGTTEGYDPEFVLNSMHDVATVFETA